MTEPSVGAIDSTVSLVVVVIQDGRELPPDKSTDVNEPVVAHEPEVHARIAGLDVYALELTDGKGSVTVVVDPTAALYVTPVPLSHGYNAQLQAGVLTVTVKLTVTAV